MRVDLYTTVHKAQRFHLFHLSDEIGLADLTDSASQRRITTSVRHMIEHLQDHARNEETYIHPLFQKLGSQADRFEEAHHDLETALAHLDAIVTEGKWDDLYPAYAHFLGTYLLHLDDEERAQREILWPNYGDDVLGAVFGRFKAERAPQAAMADLEYMLPALSVPELTRMFQGMKRSAPPPAFRGACEIAERTLQAARWHQVEQALHAG